MNEFIGPFISILGSFVITIFTTQASRKKMDAEIENIYGRLGLDKEKFKAESANTWMEVAHKAVEQYSLAMDENKILRERVKALEERIDVLEAEKEMK